MFGHAGRMLQEVRDAEARRALEEKLRGPLPKLSNDIPLAAHAVDAGQDKPHWATLEGNNRFTPISGRLFNLTALRAAPYEDYVSNKADYGEDRKKILTEIKAVRKDLRQLGVPVRLYQHDYVPDKSNPYVVNNEDCVFLPHMKLGGTQENPEYERDIEGAGIFLGYLLKKGYATDAEIKATFGDSFLEEAQSEQVQKKLATLDNGPADGRLQEVRGAQGSTMGIEAKQP